MMEQLKIDPGWRVEIWTPEKSKNVFGKGVGKVTDVKSGCKRIFRV
jgi:hypothetical protein